MSDLLIEIKGDNLYLHYFLTNIFMLYSITYLPLYNLQRKFGVFIFRHTGDEFMCFAKVYWETNFYSLVSDRGKLFEFHP